jgi:hypothetical protein
MRSFISSFRFRVAAFVAILIATVAMMSEVYCRWSRQFSDFSVRDLSRAPGSPFQIPRRWLDEPQRAIDDDEFGPPQQSLAFKRGLILTR